MADWVHGRNLAVKFRPSSTGETIEHRRFNAAWGHSVHSDALSGVFERRRFGKANDRVLAGHIGFDERRFAASFLDERNDLLAFFLAPPSDYDPRPLAAKRNGRGAANAAGCSSDERDFAFEFEIHDEVRVGTNQR